MAGTDTKFDGKIPELYDEFLVPLIFQDYADDLAERIVAAGARHVLETAAGSGVVSRSLAVRLPADARLTVTDLNGPMLERARSRQGDDSRIDWQVCDATQMPFDAGAFDAVACQFGAMFYPDKVAGYREARRVLKSGGVFAFNIWDAIENNHFADAVTRVAGEIFADDPPLFMARTPHGHGDPDRITRDLEAAGFTDIRIEHSTRTSAAPSARHVAVAYCQGTPLRGEIEARDAARLGEVTDAAEQAIAERWGGGPVQAPIAAFVIEARAP